VLDFLWMWKVASLPMLREVAYRKKSYWWVYKALRQLQKEKYIELLPRGKNLDQEVWTLTEHGFEVVLMDRDDIKEYRYRVHAPAHDFLGTCLQLGDVWQTKTELRHFTEQMLTSLAPSSLPKGFRHPDSEHIPDGLTLFSGAIHNVIVGYEVDLNLKAKERYDSTAQYYLSKVRANVVIWLVRNEWIAKQIVEIFLEQYEFRNKRENILRQFAFVLVDDFKNRTWGAEVIMGPLKGESIRKLHANLLQTLGNDTTKLGQKEMRDIFFPKFRSPQKLGAYEKGVDSKND
jgi:hypothetical protein